MSKYRGIKLRLDAGIGLVYIEISFEHPTKRQLE